MSVQRKLTIHSSTLLLIIQLTKGKQPIIQALMHRFKRSFERFKFGDLSAWHELEVFKVELCSMQKRFDEQYNKIITTVTLDKASLAKVRVPPKLTQRYTLHTLVDTALMECLERIDKVFALLEVLALQPTTSYPKAIQSLRHSLKHYCLQTVLSYLYTPRKPSFYLGNYCQAPKHTRCAMVQRTGLSVDAFRQLVAVNALALLPEHSKQKLLKCSTY